MLLPLRDEHNLRLFPAVVGRPEASALPVNLPNLRLRWKGDFPVLKQRRGPQSHLCWTVGMGGIPWHYAERGGSGNCFPRVLVAPTNAPAAPEDSGQQNLTVWGAPWQIFPRPGPSPKCGQLLESGWI